MSHHICLCFVTFCRLCLVLFIRKCSVDGLENWFPQNASTEGARRLCLEWLLLLQLLSYEDATGKKATIESLVISAIFTGYLRRQAQGSFGALAYLSREETQRSFEHNNWKHHILHILVESYREPSSIEILRICALQLLRLGS